jgi:hypothetical protein
VNDNRLDTCRRRTGEVKTNSLEQRPSSLTSSRCGPTSHLWLDRRRGTLMTRSDQHVRGDAII